MFYLRDENYEKCLKTFYITDCGSCYTFAGIAVIEAAMCRKSKQCVKLSEQEVVECTKSEVFAI